jgi:O-acetyl-ADP-ribose deacetylase (regulator of RNase III)
MAKKPVTTCFVIMPYGKRRDAKRKLIDFEQVYSELIESTLKELDLRYERSDRIDEAGWIQPRMFERIYEADVAVVDITTLNPNVFYELGIRHALADDVTVLIKRAGTPIPFNIQGLAVIEYDISEPALLDEAKKKIADYIRNGLMLHNADSPVHRVLGLRINRSSNEIGRTDVVTYRLRDAPGKQIGLVTGDLRNVKGIDIWVNSENTNMQMARFFDQSISSVIRYYGAKREKGHVVEDTIADALHAVAPAGLDAGEVVGTEAGALTQKNGVKYIFHAAAVSGQVGKGYSPIQRVSDCVRNALELADDPRFEEGNPTSILFPLLGTGTGRGELEKKAAELIRAAIDHLEAEPPCRITHVYFLVLTERQLAVCQGILQKAEDVVIS